MKQSTHQFHTKTDDLSYLISYLKIFSMQCKKNIRVEDSKKKKKKKNIASYINIYTNLFTYVMQDDCVVDKS